MRYFEERMLSRGSKIKRLFAKGLPRTRKQSGVFCDNTTEEESIGEVQTVSIPSESVPIHDPQPPLHHLRQPSLHLRIKARQVQERLLSPHRSPPSRPYTPTSTTSSSQYAAIHGSDQECVEDKHNHSADYKEKSLQVLASCSESEAEEAGPVDVRPHAQVSHVKIPTKNPARFTESITTGDFDEVEHIIYDDTSSIYPSGSQLIDQIPFEFSNDKYRASKRTSRVVSTQQYGANPVSKNSNANKRFSYSLSQVWGSRDHSGPIIPERRRLPPAYAPPRPPPHPTAANIHRQNTFKACKRASVASSMASFIPYILKYNSMVEEGASVKSSEDMRISDGIPESFHFENAETESILSNHRQIELILSGQDPAPPVQPLYVRKEASLVLAPCKDGVREYAELLDKGFEQYSGVEPDYQFREKILRGTSPSYLIRRRSRILDKNLPALPVCATQFDKLEEHHANRSDPRPSRFASIRRKLKIFT